MKEQKETQIHLSNSYNKRRITSYWYKKAEAETERFVVFLNYF